MSHADTIRDMGALLSLGSSAAIIAGARAWLSTRAETSGYYRDKLTLSRYEKDVLKELEKTLK